MKKFLALLSVSALVLSMTACGGKEEKTFKVGFDAEYPPYGYMDENGEYTGFDLELAQGVCEINGWTYEAVPINWDSKDMELNSGNIDCIWNGFTINGREDDYTWSVPYVDNSQVIVCAENSGIASLADLEGKVVGVQAASAALDALNNDHADLVATFEDLQEFGDYNSAFVELQAGSIDAVAMDVGVANYQIKSRGEGFMVLEEAISVEQYGIGFKKGNDELKDEVEEALMKLVDDGTFAELAEKYEISDLVCLGN
ncbi:MAG: amino acid ABC transporter substrate-binding protein [Firmicutes bacterium]|nr:amino acid ABC transporter substrate-binding protein [Bacillota bacterium]